MLLTWEGFLLYVRGCLRFFRALEFFKGFEKFQLSTTLSLSPLNFVSF